MSIPAAHDRRITAALADADNAIADASNHLPESSDTPEGMALDYLTSGARSSLIALTELVSVVRAGPRGPEPDEVGLAEQGVVNAAYHLALCQPAQHDELLRRLVEQVRRHHAALSAQVARGVRS